MNIRRRNEGALALKPYEERELRPREGREVYRGREYGTGTRRAGRAPAREMEIYAEPQAAPLRDYRAATHRFDSRKTSPAPIREKKRFKLKLKYVLAVTMAFAAIFMVLYRQVQIEQQVLELDKMKKALQSEQKRGEDLSLELAMRLDIEQVRSVAEGELGMEYPIQGQMKAIVLPPIQNESTAVYAAESAPIPKESRAGKDGVAGLFDALMESFR